MDVHPLIFFSLPLLLLSLPTHSRSSSTTITITNNDTATLLLFRSQADTHGNLLSNWTLPSLTTTSSACSACWLGVRCFDGNVTALTLPSLDLRGPIDSLSSLYHLRLLDLHGNRLNATLDPIAALPNLKLVYLSGNDFSGEIPPTISSLTRLLRLDLSNNNLRGPIPDSLSNLTRLLTLRLQNNELSGQIPKSLLSLPSLSQLNLSNNELYGRLPENLQTKFGHQSFSGNEGLCGSSPFPICSFTGDSPATAQIVPSLPSSSLIDRSKKQSRKGLSPGVIAAIVIANSVVFLVIALFVLAYYCGKNSTNSHSNRS